MIAVEQVQSCFKVLTTTPSGLRSNLLADPPSARALSSTEIPPLKAQIAAGYHSRYRLQRLTPKKRYNWCQKWNGTIVPPLYHYQQLIYRGVLTIGHHEPSGATIDPPPAAGSHEAAWPCHECSSRGTENQNLEEDRSGGGKDRCEGEPCTSES